MRKYKAIGTKVSPEFHETFRGICRDKGIKPYKAVQMMVDTFVRYTDSRHRLSPAMERVMGVFEHMSGWDNAFNLADAYADPEVLEAIYLIGEKGKQGSRAVMVSGEEQTCNVQEILERMIETLTPELYRRLRALAVEMACGSLLDLLFLLADAQTILNLNEEMREEFSDNCRHEFGRTVEYGERTKRKKSRDMEKDWQPIGY